MGAPQAASQGMKLAYKVLRGKNVKALEAAGKTEAQIIKIAEMERKRYLKTGIPIDPNKYAKGKYAKGKNPNVTDAQREAAKKAGIDRARKTAARNKGEKYDIPEIDEFDHPLGIDDITDIGLKDGGLVCKKPRKKGRRGMGAATRGGGAVS